MKVSNFIPTVMFTYHLQMRPTEGYDSIRIHALLLTTALRWMDAIYATAYIGLMVGLAFDVSESVIVDAQIYIPAIHRTANGHVSSDTTPTVSETGHTVIIATTETTIQPNVINQQLMSAAESV